MNNPKTKQLLAFERLLKIIDDLRNKCPWDKKQTLESLRPLTLEEAYELAEALVKKNPKEIEKELGDLLLHIVFYAKIGSEKKWFDMESIANSICEKLIYRHPHIYDNTKVNDAKEVEKNWEKLKLKQNNNKVLSGVPKSLPALIKAHRIQDKASGIGFDWENKIQVWEKIQEELKELQEAIADKEQQDIENEFGDVLFSLVNYARFIGVNPENALEKTNRKFIKRFEHIEKFAQSQNKNIYELTLQQMETQWNKAKKSS